MLSYVLYSIRALVPSPRFYVISPAPTRAKRDENGTAFVGSSPPYTIRRARRRSPPRAVASVGSSPLDRLRRIVSPVRDPTSTATMRLSQVHHGGGLLPPQAALQK
eukprot:6753006-Pyramimonas_sp.AAC.1